MKSHFLLLVSCRLMKTGGENQSLKSETQGTKGVSHHWCLKA